MSDEKEKESQNQEPTEELSKEDLQKVQGGDSFPSVWENRVDVYPSEIRRHIAPVATH